MEQKEVNKGGRPKTVIDWEQIAFRLQSGTSGAALAEMLGIDPHTLYKHCIEDNGVAFSEYQKKCRSEGVENIRLKQYEVAMSGDKSMLIFLGKNYLGQRDKIDVTTNDENINKPDKIEIIMPQRMREMQEQKERERIEKLKNND